jgi:membrane-associated phospholipid phosphatase
MEDYFFSLGLTNILCDLGFILFPVAGPMYTVGHFYKVPLEGSFWTPIGEYVRRELQYMGGTIPSPHCAAATIMWAMAFRYHRPTFWFLTPLVLSLYVSTFYGRYHYLSDAIVGIAVAFFAIRVVPNLTRVWERALRKPVAAEVLEPVTTTETVR